MKAKTALSVAPYVKNQAVVINAPQAGQAFNGAHGHVKALSYRNYKRGKKKAGWWATVDADPPPGIKKARIVLHVDLLLPEDIYNHRERHREHST